MSAVSFLIVDDAVLMRKILGNIIGKQMGYIIVGEASNGVEAVELAERFKPDIITMDITMPEMNGLEAVKMIKQISPNSKIIMVSAMGQQEMIIDALKFGAKDFIVKPFDEERVIASIKRIAEV